MLLGCRGADRDGAGAAAIAPVPTNYPPDTSIATIDGQPITMGELDTVVRLTLALDQLRKRSVPQGGTPEMRAYEKNVLKRMIDRRLVMQAIERDGLRLPAEIAPVEDHIQSYLQRIDATRAQLDEAMASFGVPRETLDTWFKETRTMNFYFLARSRSKDPASEGGSFATAWLAEEWRARAIDVDFHDFQPPGDTPSDVTQPSEATQP